MNETRRHWLGASLLTVLLGTASMTHADTVFESFEGGFGPWRANADIQRPWSTTRTTEQAEDGLWSIKIVGNGLNDDGTIWLVRQFRLPAGTWNVGLEFYMWRESDGAVGAVPSIGFIGLREPMVESDFTLSPEGEVFGAFGDPAGWGPHSMSRTLNVNETSTAWVAVGYNITFETIITHFFDSITVTGVPTQCGDGFCIPGESPCNCPTDCGTLVTAEVCDDGDDNDCDGFPDCHDSDCSTDLACELGCNADGFCEELEDETSCEADCGPGPMGVCDFDGVCELGEDVCNCPEDCGAPPASELDCTDGVDNDCDAAADCNDLDCDADPACQVPCDNDGICESGEDCGVCPNDCISGGGASCGNGVCEAGDGEDCVSCPSDCNGAQGGKPSNRFCCGDGDGQNPVSCGDSRCTSGGFSCTDVPASPSCCGDAVCEGIEDSCNCAVDCGTAPTSESNCSNGLDEDCDGLTDCNDDDCTADPACNTGGCDGDGVCAPGEDCETCPADCDGQTGGKPSGRYCCGNGVLEGPEGDGSICDGNP